MVEKIGKWSDKRGGGMVRSSNLKSKGTEK